MKLVVACEKGRLEDRACALVEGHDVEKTGISVDEMVSKEGKNSLVTHSHLYNRQNRKNSLRLSNTSSRLALLKWTS